MLDTLASDAASPEAESPIPTVVGIGELLWDCFADFRRPGGAPANVAWHANQIGFRGLVVSRVGRDEEGRLLRAALEERGLDLRFVQVDETMPTGLVGVDTSDLTAPRYTIEEPAAWDALEMDEHLSELARGAAAVCYGTLFQRHETSRESLHAFLANATDALRLYDVNLRQDFYDRAWIERSLRAAHVVKLNEQEAVQLGLLLDASAPTPQALATYLHDQFGVGITCVTRSDRGCVVVEEDDVVEVPGYPVQVGDPVGAGDAFSAGFLAARLAGEALPESARYANAVGALVASRQGAMPQLEKAYAALHEKYLTDDPVDRARRGIGGYRREDAT